MSEQPKNKNKLGLDGLRADKLEDRKDDFYATTPEYLPPLLENETLPKRIWEPCCGDGAISKFLEANGFDVVSSDLVDRGFGAKKIDFLMELKAPEGIDCIVSNPPYKLADEFVRKGLELCSTVIFLLRFAYMEGGTRSDIIDHHLPRVWLGRDRGPMMHRHDLPEELKTLKQGRAPMAWFVFTREKTNGDIIVRRIWWVDPKTRAKKDRQKKTVVKAIEPDFISLLDGSNL